MAQQGPDHNGRDDGRPTQIQMVIVAKTKSQPKRFTTKCHPACLVGGLQQYIVARLADVASVHDDSYSRSSDMSVF